MNWWWRLLAMILAGMMVWLPTLGLAQGLRVGDKAPPFSLPATTAETISLADYLDRKPVVLFFYIAAFGRAWTADALAFQLDLPKFEALHAQVLGISVDWNEANQAWAREMGVTYPLLSDLQRLTTTAYGVLFDDPKLAENPKTIPVYLRGKGSWFVIDKAGVIRAAKIVPIGEQISTDEILQVLQDLLQP